MFNDSIVATLLSDYWRMALIGAVMAGVGYVTGRTVTYTIVTSDPAAMVDLCETDADREHAAMSKRTQEYFQHKNWMGK